MKITGDWVWSKETTAGKTSDLGLLNKQKAKASEVEQIRRKVVQGEVRRASLSYFTHSFVGSVGFTPRQWRVTEEF